MTIESICNQSLDAIGYKKHIGSIWEGSKAARVALNTWAETRDAMLSSMQPDWARKDAAVAVLKTAPAFYDATTPWTTAFPDMPWRYEYDTPSDCIVPLTLKPRPFTLPVWRPRYARFRIKTDITYTLLGDDPAPVLTYIWRITDPELWREEFIEAMVEVLAKKFQRALVGAHAPQPQQREPRDANAA